MQPSSGLTTKIRNDIQSNREALKKGTETDQQVSQLLSKTSPTITILAQQIQRVSTTFSELVIGKPDQLVDTLDSIGEQITIDKLTSTYNKSLALKKQRESIIQELKVKIQSDDISGLLLLNKNKEARVFQTELDKFKIYSSRLNDNLNEQNSLITELQKDVEKARSLKTFTLVDKSFKVASKITRTWLTDFEMWRDALEGLQKGVQFYSYFQLFILF